MIQEMEGLSSDGILQQLYHLRNKVNELVRAQNLINKPVTTTNEQPKKFDLDQWFGPAERITATLYRQSVSQHFHNVEPKRVIQFNGFEVVLFEDGTYDLGDTTG